MEASTSATAAPVVVDPSTIEESLADHRAAKVRKSGAAWRKLICNLFDDDPHSRASAGKNFLKDRDKLVQEMGLTEEEATRDLLAMSEFVRLEKKIEAYDRDQRSHLEKRAKELPGELEKADACLRSTNKMLQGLGVERERVRMDLRVADERRERLRSMVLRSPRLFDAPAPVPVAAKPAADDSVTVKPTPTDDRQKVVTLHEVPIERQDRQDDSPTAPKTKPATGGGRQPLILPDIAPDDRADPTGQDRQEDYDPLGR